jgi:hypothetical protein
MANEPKVFDTEEDARTWMDEQVDDPCVDNYRFAFHDDSDAMAKYGHAEATGCCGSFDREVVVAGRPASIGCNYGH